MCEDSYTEEIDCIDHNYEVKEETEPTCTEVGFKTYQCTMCEDSHTEEIDAIGHSESEWTVVKEAGVFSKGVKNIICENCGEVLESEEIPSTVGGWFTSLAEMWKDLWG